MSSLIHPTAFIHPDTEIGSSVEIGPFSVIHAGVQLGDDSVVGSHCILGEGDRGPLIIGPRAIIRSQTIIYGASTIGPELESGHNVTMREGLTIGRNLRVGTGCDLQGNASIGSFVRLVANIHVTQHSTIEDFVWMLAWVLTTNDPHPPSDTCTMGPTIKRAAVITSNVTIFPHVTVGEMSLVASNSLVTRDVEPRRIVRGTPARDVGSVFDMRCGDGKLDVVYPWWNHFRRGYPDCVAFTDDGPTYNHDGQTD